ncbi:MAG: hypothetical protein ACRYFS_01410 [Janthinobacterium lividum]
MSRSSKNKIRKSTLRTRRIVLSALTAATLSVGVLPVTTHAAGYSFQQHLVNAGILVNGSDPAPYLFYVFNNRPDVKPTDVTLVNPLAPSTAQQNTAAYWEVSLNSISDSQMAQYNVLYLPAGTQAFGPALNEKLRRYVDNGGQLIVEYGTAASANVPGLFTGAGPVSGSVSSTIDLPIITAPLFLRHPITSQPYSLTAQDVNGLITPSAYISANTADAIHSGEFGNIFSPVLVDASGPVVSAAQIGAGQVIVSALNIGGGVTVDPNYRVPATTGVLTFNPANLYAPLSATDNLRNQTSDLKLLANIITWSQTHPNENKSSHGNASNAGLPSFSQAWQYPLTTVGTAPSGATIWGNFVFAVDANGILRAFDAYPSEYLTAAINPATTPSTDDGIADFSTGTSYDQIWNKSGFAKASAPTLATFKGVSYVFVEKNDGSVVSFNAVTGGAGLSLTAPASGSPFTGVAPAPTYYDGRIYAGQADGTLVVYDLNEGGTGVAVTLDPSTNPGETVTAPPSVGTLANVDSNAIIAVVSTNYNIYTVLVGARNEPLKSYTVNGAITGYSINRQGQYDLTNIFADTSSSHAPFLQAYDYNGNLVTGTANATAPSPQDPLFPITTNNGYYTDWDMDFAAAVGTNSPGTPVNLNYVSGTSFGGQSSLSQATISAPAIDRHGDYFYTETSSANGTNGVNSYVVGVANATIYNKVRLKFRFLMPTGAVGNDDGVLYGNLQGFKFVGAPVVDDQDNVYAVATNGALATVLCFRGDQQVTAVFAPGATTFDLTNATITQQDETGVQNTITGGNSLYGQFTASEDSVSFSNFSGRGPYRVVAGNLTEPQTVTATAQDGTGGTATLAMRTNLAWYVAPFAITTGSTVPGLSLVGSGLLMTDGTTLYKLSTTPLVGSGREVAATLTEPSESPIGAGQVGAPPSIGGNVMVINGINGIAALTRQVTVIADSNRILGVDGSGSAVWAVDATTRVGTDGATPVSTRVPFSHPTALSQFALNDYLVADTGNNRCVRFDNGGNVHWELTQFQDPQGLMAAGQPLTLSQPSSVEIRQATVSTASTLYPGDAATYYLIADSGNGRLLEVADFVNPNGNLDGNHVLTWVSHTADRDNRHYRYGSATYYTNATTNPASLEIAATVTNLRVTSIQTSPGVFKLGPASSDAPGGSIVVFNYPATVAPYNAAAASDLVFATAGLYVASVNGGSTTYQPLTIRNPRFLKLSAPATTPAAGDPGFDFLYADDNGALDLSYQTFIFNGRTTNGFVAGADRLQFSPANYQAMTNPAFGVSTVTTTNTTTSTGQTISQNTTASNQLRNVPFIPTSVQVLGTDSQTNATGTTTTRRYLITQNYSQGELGTVNTTTATSTSGTTTTSVVTKTGKLGGEIFEVDVTNPPPTANPSGITTPGGFGDNQTLSHPDLTGPLTQPTFGVRLP